MYECLKQRQLQQVAYVASYCMLLYKCKMTQSCGITIFFFETQKDVYSKALYALSISPDLTTNASAVLSTCLQP